MLNKIKFINKLSTTHFISGNKKIISIFYNKKGIIYILSAIYYVSAVLPEE